MIEIIKLNNSEPYKIFNNFYEDAINAGEEHIEAISVASLDKENFLVDSRYVNLKYINDNEWIFFSNYQSPKSIQFKSHDQVAISILWKSIYVQIRMLANITKTSEVFSDNHFLSRSDEKNALAVSSKQSDSIDSYESVLNKYNETLKDKRVLNERPKYWGGYSFKPYSFEFWEGNIYRLNKREKFLFSKDNETWIKEFLQP